MFLSNMDQRKLHSIWLQPSGLCFLRSGGDVVVKIGHNDFLHHRGKSQGPFSVVTGCKGASSYLVSASHHFSLRGFKMKSVSKAVSGRNHYSSSQCSIWQWLFVAYWDVASQVLQLLLLLLSHSTDS